MKGRFLLTIGFCVFAAVGFAGPLARIGHTTLIPRHTSPDDRGMYAAIIDPGNGYAYFVGSYLFKLDLSGALPAPVGPGFLTGQFPAAAIDPAAGYAYFPGGSITRYALGIGANPVTPAGSLTLSAGSASTLAIDDSDPNPINHYLYALVNGTPARVVKVALSTLTEVSSVTLAAGENTFVLCTVADAQKGYAYFVNLPNTTPSNIH